MCVAGMMLTAAEDSRDWGVRGVRGGRGGWSAQGWCMPRPVGTFGRGGSGVVNKAIDWVVRRVGGGFTEGI